MQESEININENADTDYQEGIIGPEGKNTTNVGNKKNIYFRYIKEIFSIFDFSNTCFHRVEQRYQKGYLPVVHTCIKNKHKIALHQLSNDQLVQLLYKGILQEKLCMNNQGNISTDTKKEIWIDAIKKVIEDRIIDF